MLVLLVLELPETIVPKIHPRPKKRYVQLRSNAPDVRLITFVKNVRLRDRDEKRQRDRE